MKILGSNKDKERQRLTQTTAFNVLQKTVDAFQDIAGNTGVHGLQEGVKCLSILLDAIKVFRPDVSGTGCWLTDVAENVPKHRRHRLLDKAHSESQ